MKLIFGLGNPGEEYSGTRHNTGFLTLDAYAVAKPVAFSSKPKFFADVAEVAIEGEKVLLVKPHTFYNESGRAYRAVCDFYKVAPAETLIIHDELALPFGTVRVREGGSDAGNNGIKSINQYGGQGSMRLRVGVSNDMRATFGDVDFVLGRFSQTEIDQLNDTIVPSLHRMIDDFIHGNLAVSSHRPIDN